MLLRQITSRGRHDLLLTTARLSQRRRDATLSLPLRTYVTSIINRKQSFLRHSNSLVSMPAIVSSCSLLEQQRHYGRQSYDFNNAMNQAALMTAAAVTAGLGTAAVVASTKNDDDPAALKFSQFHSKNNQICNCEASVKESETKLTATSPQNSSITDEEEDEQDNLPTYTMSQVSNYNGQLSPTNPHKRIWMSYGGMVYDVTEFVANHPGGSEKILMGAGGAIEPYWYLYRQHFASPLPLNLLSKMLIGKLHPTDQDLIDEQMENVTEQTPDPYENEPQRNSTLIVHGDTPMNAEVPEGVITERYLTPNDLFYIRHHHPVPYLSEGELEEFRLEVDLTLMFPDALKKRKKAAEGGGDDDDDEEEVALPATTAVDIVRRETTDTTTSTSCSNSVVAKLSLDQIKSLPKVELISTLQCSGNRRGGFNGLRQTSGTPWGQGAISTAKWGGARLIDVLMLAMEEVSKDQASTNEETEKKTKQSSLIETLHRLQTLIDDHPELQHLRFESLDGMLASIDANKGLNPFGDVIVAYEMNGEDLPRDHGYPLRVIVPGYAAVRNVKWLKKLELAEEEAEGTWQRGLNYKILPPTVLDAKEVDLNIMPGLSEECVFSGITKVENLSHTTPLPTTTTTALEEEIFGSMLSMAPFAASRTPLTPGETVLVKTSGWAYAGGGRNIVRVDVTGNNGKSWQTATITEGSNQPLRRAWAWVFWECEVPAVVCEDGVSVELACKGVDMAFNTQPESMGGMWNVRGLVNNSYYRVKHKVM
mmetsp:Transcript_9335/g.15450  ORF Transcript_9335/g.15450 Transcript_9335/m.15450 type:complete len:763 (-) Transcript_9335:174-2462(-)